MQWSAHNTLWGVNQVYSNKLAEPKVDTVVHYLWIFDRFEIHFKSNNLPNDGCQIKCKSNNLAKLKVDIGISPYRLRIVDILCILHCNALEQHMQCVMGVTLYINMMLFVKHWCCFGIFFFYFSNIHSPSCEFQGISSDLAQDYCWIHGSSYIPPQYQVKLSLSLYLSLTY